MPKRPPKEWFNKTLKKVKKMQDGIKSPQKLVGWLWYHQMKPATKRAILKATETARKRRRKR